MDPFQNSVPSRSVSHEAVSHEVLLYSKQTGLPYQDLLGLIQKSLNRQTLSVKPYKFTPELLMFGNSLPDPEELLNVEDNSKEITPTEFCNDIIKNLSTQRDGYLGKRNKLNDQKRDIINQKRIHETLVPGDIVYVQDLNIAHTAGGALKSKFIGPYVVETVNETRLECTLQSLKERKK